VKRVRGKKKHEKLSAEKHTANDKLWFWKKQHQPHTNLHTNVIKQLNHIHPLENLRHGRFIAHHRHSIAAINDQTAFTMGLY
jgi:hypothetical protein